MAFFSFGLFCAVFVIIQWWTFGFRSVLVRNLSFLFFFGQREHPGSSPGQAPDTEKVRLIRPLAIDYLQLNNCYLTVGVFAVRLLAVLMVCDSMCYGHNPC